MTLHQGYALAAGESLEDLDMGGGSVLGLKVTGEQSNGVVSVIGGLVTSGGPPRHVHEAEDEVVICLEGELTFEVGAERGPAARGVGVVPAAGPSCGGEPLRHPLQVPHRGHSCGDRALLQGPARPHRRRRIAFGPGHVGPPGWRPSTRRGATALLRSPSLRAGPAPRGTLSPDGRAWAQAQVLDGAHVGAVASSVMTVVTPGEGRPLLPGMTLKVGTGELPHGSLSVVEGVLAPGQYIGPHTHTREDEVTLVMEGRIVALVGETVVEVHAGSFLLKPSGVLHAFGNPGAEPARVHELHAPGGLEEFYAFMHLNAFDAALKDEERHAAFRECCQEFGLVQHFDMAEEVRARLGL